MSVQKHKEQHWKKSNRTNSSTQEMRRQSERNVKTRRNKWNISGEKWKWNKHMKKTLKPCKLHWMRKNTKTREQKLSETKKRKMREIEWTHAKHCETKRAIFVYSVVAFFFRFVYFFSPHVFGFPISFYIFLFTFVLLFFHIFSNMFC